jgi:hypothetical protein
MQSRAVRTVFSSIRQPIYPKGEPFMLLLKDIIGMNFRDPRINPLKLCLTKNPAHQKPNRNEAIIGR